MNASKDRTLPLEASEDLHRVSGPLHMQVDDTCSMLLRCSARNPASKFAAAHPVDIRQRQGRKVAKTPTMPVQECTVIESISLEQAIAALDHHPWVHHSSENHNIIMSD